MDGTPERAAPAKPRCDFFGAGARGAGGESNYDALHAVRQGRGQRRRSLLPLHVVPRYDGPLDSVLDRRVLRLLLPETLQRQVLAAFYETDDHLRCALEHNISSPLSSC